MAKFARLLLLSVTSTLFFGVSSKHPLHVSTTEINFNAKNKSLEITSRIFTDDFEAVLAKKYNTKTDLSKESVHKAMDELVKKYMASNLKYNINGKPMTANYIGFEKDGEATNVYLEIENAPTLQKINVANSILYDLFDDQMSILHVTQNGNRKSTRTNYPSTNMQAAF